MPTLSDKITNHSARFLLDNSPVKFHVHYFTITRYNAIFFWSYLNGSSHHIKDKIMINWYEDKIKPLY